MARGRPVFEPTEKQRGQIEAMLRYGIPQHEIARVVGIDEKTLAKHFRAEIDTAATKANAQVGEFIFSTVIGVPIPGRSPVNDERARAMLAMFWAKTRMGWKETAVIEHKDVDAVATRERVSRKLDRIAAALEKGSVFTKTE